MSNIIIHPQARVAYPVDLKDFAKRDAQGRPAERISDTRLALALHDDEGTPAETLLLAFRVDNEVYGLMLEGRLRIVDSTGQLVPRRFLTEAVIGNIEDGAARIGHYTVEEAPCLCIRNSAGERICDDFDSIYVDPVQERDDCIDAVKEAYEDD